MTRHVTTLHPLDAVGRYDAGRFQAFVAISPGGLVHAMRLDTTTNRVDVVRAFSTIDNDPAREWAKKMALAPRRVFTWHDAASDAGAAYYKEYREAWERAVAAVGALPHRAAVSSYDAARAVRHDVRVCVTGARLLIFHEWTPPGGFRRVAAENRPVSDMADGASPWDVAMSALGTPQRGCVDRHADEGVAIVHAFMECWDAAPLAPPVVGSYEPPHIDDDDGGDE